METIVAIILIVIMLLFDTHAMEQFIDYTRKPPTSLNHKKEPPIGFMSHDDTNNQDIYKTPPVKKLMWVFNDYTVSSRNWKDFYSRKHRQPTAPVINLCIKTILLHSKHYDVRIFTQDDIVSLLPEYVTYIQSCTSYYMATNFIKYAVLYKYGGIWIPKDTILLKPISYNMSNTNDYLCTFGINNLNFVDNKGQSDKILASAPHNNVIGNMIIYLKSNSRTFQNAILFKKSINKYFNKILLNCSCCESHDISIVEKCNKTHMRVSDLFSSNMVRFYKGDTKHAIGIHINDIEELPAYNYLLRMSEHQIMSSGLFMAVLFKKALL